MAYTLQFILKWAVLKNYCCQLYRWRHWVPPRGSYTGGNMAKASGSICRVWPLIYDMQCLPPQADLEFHSWISIPWLADPSTQMQNSMLLFLLFCLKKFWLLDLSFATRNLFPPWETQLTCHICFLAFYFRWVFKGEGTGPEWSVELVCVEGAGGWGDYCLYDRYPDLITRWVF